jgi:hypothetical protein
MILSMQFDYGAERHFLWQMLWRRSPANEVVGLPSNIGLVRRSTMNGALLRETVDSSL